MAVDAFQRKLIRLLAEHRREGGESYVAGGTALNLLLEGSRLSRDIDFFHDVREAVHRSFDADRRRLEAAGYALRVEIERDAFVEAVASKDLQECRLQWTQDSAFRFYPLAPHPEMGLTLHPFDLATNKVLALVGRAEPRDWVDTIHCDAKLQPLGYLFWAAAGKDPGLNPQMILNEAARTARYTELELGVVEFEAPRPSAAELSTLWKKKLVDAGAVVESLPAMEVGKRVCDLDGNLLTCDATDLRERLEADRVRFFAGSLGGAFPTLHD